MLTTDDLYEKPGYRIEIGNLVRFNLLRGLEVKTYGEPFKSKKVEKSRNRNANRTLTGKITNYLPRKNGDLEIRGIMRDGYTFTLRLNQCRDLKRLD